MQIFVAGLANVETTLRVEEFPIPYYPVEFSFHGVNATVSGVGFNVAAALNTLGEDVHLATLIGSDRQGRWVQAEMKKRHLHRHGAVCALDATCQSVILTDPSGRRQAHTDLKDIQQTAYPLDQAREHLAGSDFAVLCNIEFARPLLLLAQELGVPVVTDVHVLGNVEDPYNRDFMAAAQVLFLSDEGLEDPHAFITSIAHRYRPQVVVMGRGGAGALMYERATDTFTHQKALTCRPVVNTVGAGDALCAAFAQGYFSGLDAPTALRRAVVFAGWKTGSVGGAQGFLTASELDQLLSKDGCTPPQ